MSTNNLPIGVFDSGVGGLTVLTELKARFPHESFVYLGDTARIPYGTKSPETVCQYATNACDLLLQSGIKLLVIACNTVSAIALPLLQQRITQFPITGVLEPGALTAVNTSKTGHIAVLATEATIQAKAYHHAIHRLRPDFTVVGKSCSLFVALAEEGWSTGPVAEAAARAYLEPLLADHPKVDTLLLGCTHFPVLQNVIRKVIGPNIAIINSAEVTATAVDHLLTANGLHAEQDHRAVLRFFVTDAPERFIRVAERFMAMKLDASDLQWVDVQFSAQDRKVELG